MMFSVRMDAPKSIDYHQFFCDAFYKLSYTDYLFILPIIMPLLS